MQDHPSHILLLLQRLQRLRHLRRAVPPGRVREQLLDDREHALVVDQLPERWRPEAAEARGVSRAAAVGGLRRLLVAGAGGVRAQMDLQDLARVPRRRRTAGT